MKRYYFDWAATAVPETFVSGEIPFGNPSSKHREGVAAREALEDARKRCAAVLGINPEQLYWTSGGTESNAIVLFSYLKHLSQTSGVLLAGISEHPSISANCAVLQDFGAPVSFIDLEKEGAVSVNTLSKALEKQKNAGMIAIMTMNNETGAIADIKSLSTFIRAHTSRRIFFHSDMVQALGKIPLNLSDGLVDSASFSAHKIGGPRGIGLLYLKQPLDVLISGGRQERGIRSGTENLAGALAFTECIEKYASEQNLEAHYRDAAIRMQFLINSLRDIKGFKIIPECRKENDPRFSPYILLCAFDNIPGEVMARVLDDKGFAVSTGSACSASSKNHPVLEAMGIDSKTAFNTIRISQGWSTTQDDIKALVSCIKTIVTQQFS
ncbi:MAG: cysteine desulfurase [Spirochaetaceae bacterium]|jgi:cysteine desulfurase|nr:cysteine desulfurase [Spirochaetaceae bacterium]